MLKMHASSKHAADLSRLLDPSYCSTSTSKGYVSPQAYVDPYGDLHDPDYRHFPTSFPSSSSSSAKRHNSPRPHWDLALDNSNALDDDDDELDEEDSFFLSTSTAARPQNHSRYTATRRVAHDRRPRESSFSTYNNTINYYSPHTTISTLPTSYESDKTDLSRCSDADEGKTKKKRRLSKASREKEKDREGLWGGSVTVVPTETYYRGSLDHSRDLPPTQEEEAEDAQRSLTSPKRTIREAEFVPTCSQSLRRQWQAFSLRFRFGVFRAQRNFMRRVHLFLWVWVVIVVLRHKSLDPFTTSSLSITSIIFISCTPLYHRHHRH